MNSEPADAKSIQELMDQCNRLVDQGHIVRVNALRESESKSNTPPLQDILDQCDRLVDLRVSQSIY